MAGAERLFLGGGEAMVKSVVCAIGSSLGRQIVRGIMALLRRR